jgi:hypothetical protein
MANTCAQIYIHVVFAVEGGQPNAALVANGLAHAS